MVTVSIPNTTAHGRPKSGGYLSFKYDMTDLRGKGCLPATFMYTQVFSNFQQPLYTPKFSVTRI